MSSGLANIAWAPPSQSFESTLRRCGRAPLRRGPVTTLQVNVGKRCNQACHHCHVGAGPTRTEAMRRDVAERVVALLEASTGIQTVDITGGAPELNPHFSYLVTNARRLRRRVIDRCNLTVLLEPDMQWLPRFLHAHEVELVCSLPCYTFTNVDQQRGRGVFDKSIRALRWLNSLGYGQQQGSSLVLNLVYNPLGAFLPPPQAELTVDYRRELGERFGIQFNELITLTNMPIARFADQLARRGEQAQYMGLLVNHFNPATIDGLMCRSLVSIARDGVLYDCDFNQMLELPATAREPSEQRPLTVWTIEGFDQLAGAEIATGAHCFGCTAGAGSSCAGALADGAW